MRASSLIVAFVASTYAAEVHDVAASDNLASQKVEVQTTATATEDITLASSALVSSGEEAVTSTSTTTGAETVVESIETATAGVTASISATQEVEVQTTGTSTEDITLASSALVSGGEEAMTSTSTTTGAETVVESVETATVGVTASLSETAGVPQATDTATASFLIGNGTEPVSLTSSGATLSTFPSSIANSTGNYGASGSSGHSVIESDNAAGALKIQAGVIIGAVLGLFILLA